MSRWTNGRWRSTLHRVVNPPRELTGSTRRLSLVAFTGPHENSEIACLPTCADAEHPPLFSPVRAGEYVMAKLTASMDIKSA
jgi:isopenicillin N synthase-like dioxygenase